MKINLYHWQESIFYGQGYMYFSKVAAQAVSYPLHFKYSVKSGISKIFSLQQLVKTTTLNSRFRSNPCSEKNKSLMILLSSCVTVGHKLTSLSLGLIIPELGGIISPL